MNLSSYLSFALILINFSVGLIAIARYWKERVNQIFFIFVTSISLYSLGINLLYLGVFKSQIGHFVFSVASLIPAFAFLFSVYFPQKNKKINTLLVLFIILFGVFFSGLAWTPLILKDNLKINGNLIPQYGLLYQAFLVYILAVLTVTIANFIITLINSTGIQRVQMYFITLGITSSSILIIVCNLILPSIGIHALSSLGPSFTIIFDISILYTIIRHRFLGIKFIIANVVYVLLLALYVNIAFFGTIILEIKVFNSFFRIDAYIFDVIISFVFTLLFIVINARLSLLNRIYTGVEKQNNIIESLRKIAYKNLNLNETLDDINVFLRNNIDIGNILIYGELSDQIFISKTTDEVKNFLETNGSRLSDFLDSNNNVVVTLESDQSQLKTYPLEYFVEHKIVLSIRLEADKDSVFIFFVSNSNFENTVFDLNEIEFLKILFTEIALFITRALLHQQVLDFNKNLQIKIDQATQALTEKNVEIQNAYNSVQETARQERDMLDIMGHELRTPATVVKMAAYLLDSKVSDEYGKKQIERIKDSIERQIKLINTFINTAKIDNGKIDLSLEPVRLDMMAKQAVEDHMNEAIEKGLTLSYESQNETPEVLADMARIREVVDNLITNAIKYTFTGSIKVYCERRDSEIIFSVKDSGEGIKQEDQAELFQKFKRVNNYTKNSQAENVKMIRPGGTGLGLYVSKGVVELHKGKIWVESEYGNGSTFNFSIPIPEPGELDKYRQARFSSANMFNKLKVDQSLG